MSLSVPKYCQPIIADCDGDTIFEKSIGTPMSTCTSVVGDGVITCPKEVAYMGRQHENGTSIAHLAYMSHAAC